MGALREDDFFAWSQEQAERLRRAAGYWLSDLPGVDWLGLAEEIESSESALERELGSRYRVLLMHLLEWAFQPDLQCRSWARTVEKQRDDIAELLEDNPSLEARRGRAFTRAYPRARKDAAAETGLPIESFPEVCPFTLEQVEDDSFWPKPSGGSS
jgi:hypothetical protein